MTPIRFLFILVACAGGAAIVRLDAGSLREADTPAQRGRAALLGQSHVAGMWSAEAYDKAWEQWGVAERPAEYDAAFRTRYGLHPALYENDGLPMGLRRAPGTGRAGLTIDCMLCHAGSIAGSSYVGLPNTTLDLPLLFDEMYRASGVPPFPWPFPLARSRGTTNAGAVAAFVLAFRKPDLTARFPPADLGWQQMSDLDAPAWWLWKRKKTIYCDGGTDARSTRSTMQFLLGGSTPAEQIKSLEPTWEDVREFLWTLRPPKYPFAIDAKLAASGEAIFRENCARCHGTYGPQGKYPNKIVPIDVIGTDRSRHDGVSRAWREYYDTSWFGEKYRTLDTPGYQAPPLDGIWATAPYFHNGSVPTVHGVLNSTARPERFRRERTTDADAFDTVRLGWKVETIEAPPPDDLPAMESRKIFDSTMFGKGNGGHQFGDHSSEAERMALIEYLKTL